MAAEPFNSLNGYTVGIPPVSIVDSNGNITTNVNAPLANVTANKVYANYYLYANGYSIITDPGGSNRAVQFNDQGLFNGSNSFTFNKSTNTLTVTNFVASSSANLGNVSTLKILGGDNGYFLQTDGTGNLTWAPGSGGNGGNGNPGGANTQVQFNDAGNFGGDPGFTYDKLANILTVNEIIVGNITANYIVLNWDVTANVVYSNYLYGDGSNITNVTAAHAATANTVVNNAQPNITSVGTLTSLNLSGNITNANFVTANYFSGNGQPLFGILASNVVGTIANANYAAYAGNVTIGAQPNITSLGNLSGLTVTGNTTTSNLSVSGSTATTNLNLTGHANISAGGTLRVLGDVNFTQSGNVSIGNIANFHIDGGVNGYVLSTDGAGNLSWAAGGGGGNGTPGGSNTQVQYNDSGTFGGSSFFTFNEATNNVQIAGNLIANSFAMGSGVYNFSLSNVFFATTSSTASNQVLLSIDADDIAAVDYTIISTDGIIRNFIKISCVISGSTLNYVEYSTIPVNGYTGDFSVGYDAGNIVTPASIQLKLSPQTSNLMTHKMMVTAYKE
jgi:hypothetical protein